MNPTSDRGFFKAKKDTLIYIGIFLVLFLAYFYGKLTILRTDFVRTWTDTTTYVISAERPLTSVQFWIGERAFLLPLIYKIMGVNLVNYTHYEVLSRIAHLQFLIGLFAWGVFNFLFSTKFRSFILKILSTVVIFTLGLGLHNSLWDKLILSESFSNSLFVLLLSLWILGSYSFIQNRPWKRTVYIFLLAITSLLYAFIRDTNAYLLFLMGVCLLIYSLVKKSSVDLRRLCIPSAIILIVIFGFSWINSSMSIRWEGPLVHVLQDRKSSYPEMTQYYKEKGIDLFVSFPNPERPTKTGISETTATSLANPIFMKQVKRIYLTFLLTHPIYTITAPWHNIHSLLSPNSTEYRYSFKNTPTWVNKLTDIIYPPFDWIPLAGLILVLASLFFMKIDFQTQGWILLFLLLSIFPMALLVWHGDEFEIERHAEQLMIQGRMGFWLGVLLFIEVLGGKFMAHQPNKSKEL